jgi:cell division protein ZapA
VKQLDVSIMGQSYLLSCPEGGERRLRDAVSRVDTAMCKIRDAGKVRARDRIAVLAALNLAFDLQPQDAAAQAAADTADDAAETSTGPALAGGELSRLHALAARLDAALGDDGRLL